jgi:hypothetical protein
MRRTAWLCTHDQRSTCRLAASYHSYYDAECVLVEGR